MLQADKHKFFSNTGEIFQSGIFALLCLALFLVFPAVSVGQTIIALAAFLLVTPILYNRFILKKNFESMGVAFQNKKIALVWGFAMLIFSLLTALLLSKTSYANIFVLPVAIMTNFKLFLFYELILANVVLFILVFFFHGFVLFALTPRLKWWAVAVTTILFLNLRLITKNAHWVPIMLTGGILAYKTRSFAYSYLMSLIFMIFFDTYLIFISK